MKMSCLYNHNVEGISSAIGVPDYRAKELVRLVVETIKEGEDSYSRLAETIITECETPEELFFISFNLRDIVNQYLEFKSSQILHRFISRN